MKKFYFLLVAMMVSIAANAVDYYLIGGFNGWSLKQANCKFTAQGDGTYVLDFEGTLTSGFKINDGTWGNSNANFGGNGNLTVGEVYNLTVGGSSGNIGLAENVENPHLVFNPTEKTLLITGQAVEAEYTYDLWGSFTSGTWGSVELTEADGKWVATDVEVTYNSAAFGIRKLDKVSGSQVEWLSAAGDADITEAGTFDLKVEGVNFAISAGTWSFTLDPEEMTLEVTGEGGGGDDPVVDYTAWYLNVYGPFNDWTLNGVSFNAEGIGVQENLPIGDSTFQVKIYNGRRDVIMGTENEIELDTPTLLVPVTDETPYYEMTIANAVAGDLYNVTFDAVNNMLTVTKDASSISVVEAENNVPAVYYNLQGIEVANPANGLYIEKRGDKVRKVVIR